LLLRNSQTQNLEPNKAFLVDPFLEILADYSLLLIAESGSFPSHGTQKQHYTGKATT
jgi:hypothetical protein